MSVVACPKCGAKNRVDERRAGAATPVCGRCGAELPAGDGDGDGNGHPIELTDATFDRALRDAGGKPVLVDCWATWCPPCRMLAPTIDQLAAEADGRHVIAKLDVDANQRTAARFKISSIPAMLIFKNGQLVDTLVGLQPKAAIEARLAR